MNNMKISEVNLIWSCGQKPPLIKPFYDKSSTRKPHGKKLLCPDNKNIGYLLDESRAVQLKEKVNSSSWQNLHVSRAEIFLTAACNMNCRYCNSIHYKMPEWKENEIYDLLNRLASRNTKHIQWTGGEVTVHPLLKKFVLHACSAGMSNSISTNGTATYEDYLDLASKGVSHFSISIDHPDELFFNDITRSKGQFLKILKTVEKLCAQKNSSFCFRVVINTVLTSETVASFMNNDGRKLREFLNWCMNCGADDFKFLPVSTHSLTNLFPEPGQKEKFMDICNTYVGPEYRFFHYRLAKLDQGGHGLADRCWHTCYHFLDDRTYDSAGAYPCIIHLREGGNRLYRYDDSIEEKREKLADFFRENRAENPICRTHCFDLYSALSDRTQFLLENEKD